MAARDFDRRLAAILAADVVGYSRLMGEDEGGTHARLKALRKTLIEPKIAVCRGRMVKLTGDGALVEFASVVDALECAVEVQRSIAVHNADLPPADRLEFRVGINLGDVIIDGGDIYGDGVNVAARLETLAEPGGICIADIVHQLVRGNRPDIAFADLGEQRVKNIARPIRVWRWLPDGRSCAAPATGVAAPEPLSIAVLPFDNLSGDRDQEYFSDGLTEDLITDLSQLSGLSVASRHGAFQYKGRVVGPQEVGRELGVRYLLEGSVRRASDRVRINAQLIDAASGFHKWAARFDRKLEDIFALQDEISGAIVAALEVQLAEGERPPSARRYTANVEAYDLFLRGREAQLRRTREGLAEAREALEAAIRLDPAFAAAHAVLADNYRQEWIFDWRDDPDVLDRALDLARRAVSIDDELPLAHTLLGWVHLWRKEHDQAILEAERGVALDPQNAEGWARLGHIVDFAGRPREGLPLIEKAMRLDPHFPFLYAFFLGHALQALERYEDALSAYRRAITRNPDFIGARQHAAASNAHLGRLDQAHAEAKETLRLSPRYSTQVHVRRLPYRDAAVRERLIEGLRRAGLPD